MWKKSLKPRRNFNEILEERAHRFQEQNFILQWWRWTKNMFLMKEKRDWTWTGRKDSLNKVPDANNHQALTTMEECCLGNAWHCLKHCKGFGHYSHPSYPLIKIYLSYLKEDSFFYIYSSQCLPTGHRNKHLTASVLTSRNLYLITGLLKNLITG